MAAPILVVPVPRYSDCLREHGPALCAVVQVLPGHRERARAGRRLHPRGAQQPNSGIEQKRVEADSLLAACFLLPHTWRVD